MMIDWTWQLMNFYSIHCGREFLEVQAERKEVDPPKRGCNEATIKKE